MALMTIDARYIRSPIRKVAMIIGAARRLLAAAVLVSVTVTAGCDAGDAPDRSPSTTSPASVDPAQNTTNVCALIVAAVGKGSSTALADTRLLTSGQLSREEHTARLRVTLTRVATDLRQLAPSAADPAVRAAIEQWAARMDEGAGADDPAAFFTTHYGVMLDEVEKTCKLG
jgi:hypothetical protein